jgi:hypothetical protein
VEVFLGVLLIVIAMVEIVSITMLVNSNSRAGR